MRIRSFEKGSYRVAKGDQIGGAIRNKDQAHDCKLENIEGSIEFVGQEPKIEKQGVAEGALFVVVNPSELEGIKTKIEIGIYENEKQIEVVKTNFVGPAN